VVSAEVTTELRAHSTREPLALISPRLVDADGDVVFRGARVDLRTGDTVSRPDGADDDAGDWLTAACLMVHNRLLQRIGGVDEGYFLYWEDVDLSFRGRAAGGSLVVRHDLVARHDEGGTHNRPGDRAKSPLYYRYNCRNRLLFGARHLDRRDLLRWILCTPGASWRILLRGGRRQLLHSPRPVWAAVSGSVAGIVAAVPALVRRRPAAVLPPAARQEVVVRHRRTSA
jgi:GT2 family glycosyltransferase